MQLFIRETFSTTQEVVYLESTGENVAVCVSSETKSATNRNSFHVTEVRIIRQPQRERQQNDRAATCLNYVTAHDKSWLQEVSSDSSWGMWPSEPRSKQKNGTPPRLSRKWLQPASRGRSRSFGITFGGLSCRPSSYAVNGTNSASVDLHLMKW